MHFSMHCSKYGVYFKGLTQIIWVRCRSNGSLSGGVRENNWQMTFTTANHNFFNRLAKTITYFNWQNSHWAITFFGIWRLKYQKCLTKLFLNRSSYRCCSNGVHLRDYAWGIRNCRPNDNWPTIFTNSTIYVFYK